MITTIQMSLELQKELYKRKIIEIETYEDTMEINEQTKKELEISRKEIKEGKYHTFNQVRHVLATKTPRKLYK